MLWVYVSTPKGKPTPSAFLTNTAARTPPCGWCGVFFVCFFFNATKEMIQREWCCCPRPWFFNTWSSGSFLHSRLSTWSSREQSQITHSSSSSGQLCPQLGFSAAPSPGPSPLGGQLPALSTVPALCCPAPRPHVSACRAAGEPWPPGVGGQRHREGCGAHGDQDWLRTGGGVLSQVPVEVISKDSICPYRDGAKGPSCTLPEPRPTALAPSQSQQAQG